MKLQSDRCIIKRICLIRTKKEIKFMIIQEVPIAHLWRKEPAQMRKKAGYSECIPMTFKVP